MKQTLLATDENYALAVKENVGKRWITLPGAVLAFGALAVLVLHMLGVI